jgi:endogenous inhibitor of DNA gyrase (YacG/DUF329 family)
METIQFIDSNGRKRCGILVNCKSCGKEIPTRIDQLQQYCSKECSTEARKHRIKLECAACGKSFDRTQSKTKNSKSGLQFCSRECKDESQQLGPDGIKAIQPVHYGTACRASSTYRRIYKRHHKIKKLKCVRCGYDEFECGLDIHHKDEDCSNNDIDNLISLCSCCHRGLHNKKWKFE